MRRAERASGVSAAPYAMPHSRPVSERSGKAKPSLRTNFAIAGTESNEMPRIRAFALSNSSARARNPRPSIVHPGVFAIG